MFMLVLSSIPIGASAQTDDLDTVVVLYDASHQQQFAEDNEEQGLKLMFDMVNASTRYIVKVNTENSLNDTILSDVDILIIADPDTSSEFEQDEIDGVAEFLANGSSLLILGDPTISQNSTYWNEPPFQDIGDNVGINTFLDNLNITGIRFSTNVTEDETIRCDTMFDWDHAINDTIPWVIELDTTTWDSTHPIFKDINSLLTMTGTLKPLDAPSVVATSYESSFAQYRRGPNTWGNISYPNMTLANFNLAPFSYSAINGTFPSWLAAFEFNEARVIVAGSTIMFTGRSIDLPDSDSRYEAQWFYQADNSKLFMNMLNWLSEGFAEPPSAILPITILSSVFLVVGVVFYIFKKIR